MDDTLLTEAMLAGMIAQAMDDDFPDISIDPLERSFTFAQSSSYGPTEYYEITVRRVERPE